MPTLSIGGISLNLEAESGGAVPDFLAPYVVEDPEPQMRCRGRLDTVEHLLGNETLFDSGGVWRVDAGQGGVRLVLRNGGASGVPYQVLELSDDLMTGSATLDPGALVDEEPFALRDPLLELWYSFVLFRGRGLLVHSLAVVVEGAAHLFLGESGAGKSTLGGVFADEGIGTVLSDDRVIVRPMGDEFWAFGSPWHGEDRFSSPDGAPISSVNCLVQGPSSRLEPISCDSAATGILRCCFMAGWPRTDASNALMWAADLACAVPCGNLFFTPDRGALAAIGLVSER